MNVYKFVAGTRVIRIAANSEKAARVGLQKYAGITEAPLVEVAHTAEYVVLSNLKYEAPKNPEFAPGGKRHCGEHGPHSQSTCPRC